MPMDVAALEGVAPGEAYLPRGPLPILVESAAMRTVVGARWLKVKNSRH